MRYPASEKLEIIRLVEQSHLPVRRALEQIGIPRSTFYRWCDLYRTGGPEALDDCSPRPDRVWNRIPDDVRARIVTLALDETELSPRELAVRFTDAERYFVSEASVYRLLKAHDLITSPAFIVMKAADEFKDKTTAPNQLWQTDFTYLKVTGWGWFYLSTVLDDFSRYIVAWKLCTTMKAEDVTETLALARESPFPPTSARSTSHPANVTTQMVLILCSRRRVITQPLVDIEVTKPKVRIRRLCSTSSNFDQCPSHFQNPGARREVAPCESGTLQAAAPATDVLSFPPMANLQCILISRIMLGS